MGYQSRSLEDSAENSVECDGPAQESLVGNKDLNNPVRLEANLVIVWQKNIVAFCPCPKNVPEAKVKVMS